MRKSDLEFRTKLPEIGDKRSKRTRARKGKWGTIGQRMWSVLDTKDPSHRPVEPIVPKT